MKKISIITPVFNEETALVVFFEHLLDFKKKLLQYEVEWIIVDDGSSDATPKIIQELTQNNSFIRFVIFSRNFGKEAALFAGLENSLGDLVIPIDIDLQDPLEIIFKMIEKYKEGADVVLAKRIKRSNDSFFKRFSAKMFYKLNNKIASIQLKENVGDFRLMTRQVVDEIVKLQENQLFMKGMMSWVGFKTAVVSYERPVRTSGKTKFNFLKLWELGMQGITSFSTVPLKISFYFGSIISFISFIYGIKIIGEKIFFGIDTYGYASLMVTILFFGGVQLIGIGILGEYLGKTYLESKRRPKYIIKKKSIKP